MNIETGNLDFQTAATTCDLPERERVSSNHPVRNRYFCDKGAGIAHRIPTNLFRISPSEVSIAPEGLELRFSETVYAIGRWPNLQIRYRNKLGKSGSAPQFIKPAIYSHLNALRLCSNQAWRFAAYDLVRDMPLWIHARLVPMREYYWIGVTTLAAFPESARLLENSPALFAAVAQYADMGLFDGEERSTLCTLLSARQRDLVRWLGLADSESFCRTLRKLPFYDFSWSQWQTLARNFRRREVKRVLQHSMTIADPVVSFLTLEDHAKVLSPKALAEAVTEIQGMEHSWTERREYIDEIVRLGVLFRKFGICHAPFASMIEFRKLSRRAEELLRDLPLAKGPEVDLPGFEPLATPGSLRQEGEEMGHCSGYVHFALEALEGRCCFYRVDSPVRATVCLTKGRGFSPWKLDQIQGPKNTKLPDPALDMIRRALSRAGVET